MADVLGEWGTLDFQIPPIAESVVVPLNSLLDAIMSGLNLVVETLNFIKTFPTSYLDPAAVLIEVLVEEFRAIIQDLRDIGVFITGDWRLFKSPYTELLGGFAEYERRMVARLTDRQDPTRPDVSSKTTVFAVFTYLSATSERLYEAMSSFDQLKEFFNISLPTENGLPVPNIESIKYGNDAADVLTFSTVESTLKRFDGTPPNVIRVSWKLGGSAADIPGKVFFQPPPAGFLITVSTLRDGIPLMFDRPQVDSDKEGSVDRKQQRREFGEVLDTNNSPIVLHGGFDMLDFDEELFGYISSVDDDGNRIDNRCRVYGVLSPADNAVIPLERLGGGGQNTVFQKTFLVDPGQTSRQWLRDEYSFEFRLEDMPDDAEILMVNGKPVVDPIGKASTYYVRVAALGDKGFFGENPAKEWKFDFRSDVSAPNAEASWAPFKVPMTKTSVNHRMLSQFSQPREITFSNTNTKEYMDAIRSALVVLVLTRPDMAVIDKLDDVITTAEIEAAKGGKLMIPDVALLPTGLEGSVNLFDLIWDGAPEDTFKAKWSDPIAFRTDLYRRINRVTELLYESTGSNPAVEKIVVEQTERLRTVTWVDILTDRARRATEAQTGNPIEPGTFKGFDPAAKALSDAINPGEMTLLGAINTGVDDDLFRDLSELLTLDDEELSASASTKEFGVALNPFGMGVDDETVKDMLRLTRLVKGPVEGITEEDELLQRLGVQEVTELRVESLVFTERAPHFIETPLTSPKDDVFFFEEKPAEEVEAFLNSVPSGLRMFYERHINSEGALVIDKSKERVYLDELKAIREVAGSGDLSPVFYTGQSKMAELKGESPKIQSDVKGVEVAFCRTLLVEFEDNVLVQQAAIALGIAGAAKLKSPAEGAWISRRLDDFLPSLTEVLDSVVNWVEALGVSAASTSDGLNGYIQFLEDRSADLQQFIRRVNSLLKLSFSAGIRIPRMSALALQADGTDGLLAALIAAENKPPGAAQDFGFGLALVAPTAPAFLAELLKVSDETLEGNLVDPADLPELIGIESISEEDLNPPSDPEPDVL